MTVADRILVRMFGRPEGASGPARRFHPRACQSKCRRRSRRPPGGRRVGEDPRGGVRAGVAIELLARAAPEGRVAGIDLSGEMVRQATARNAAAIRAGIVDLRHGTVERMPFADDAFDAVLAINSMQVWPDPDGGLRETRRVLRPGGRIALAFTPRSGQPRAGVTERLGSAGFADARLVELPGGFCALARTTCSRAHSRGVSGQ